MFYFKIIILLLLFLSCRRQDKKEEDRTNNSIETISQIKIRPPKSKLPKLKLSEISTNIEYIKLETSKDAMLSSGLAYFTDSSKYIFINSNGRIYQFNRSGKFVRHVGKTGRGPNEFVLHLMDIDFKDSLIYIYPRWRQKILKYDFKGKPIGHIKNELVGYPAKMKVINGQLIFANEINQYLQNVNKGGYMELYIFDPDSNKINYYLPNYYEFKEDDKTFSSKINGQEQLATYNNISYYKMQFCDTLYRVADNKIEPFIFLDMGRYKYSINNAQLKKVKDPVRSIESKLAGKILMTGMVATKNHLLLSFRFYKSDNIHDIFFCLYNLNSKELTYYDLRIINDLDGGPNIFPGFLAKPYPIYVTPSMFKIPSEEIQKDFFSGQDSVGLKFSDRKNNFKRLLDQSEINDNPILQIITLKDDF